MPLLFEALREVAEVQAFSWRVALLGSYDILHVHWPENLVRDSARKKDVGKKILAAALLLRLAITRTRVVRTVHNATPHEPISGIAAILYAALERSTHAWIRMSGNGAGLGQHSFHIPHGHYRSWYSRFVDDSLDRDELKLCFFGLIRPYKRIELLIDAFRRVDMREAKLVIAGTQSDRRYATLIASLAGQDDRVEFKDRHLGEPELAELVRTAKCVVLPYATHNSGAALLALSLGAMVALPQSPLAEELRAEVGNGWVIVYSPPLSCEVLKEILSRRSRPKGEPNLKSRDWSLIARKHAGVYSAVLSARTRK